MARGAAPGVLGGFRYGSGDLTTRIVDGEFWRATYTPDGPGTLHLSWQGAEMSAEAWGPGGDWLVAHTPALTGALDPGG